MSTLTEIRAAEWADGLPVNLAAPVGRFDVGQLIRWDYGGQDRFGVIVSMAERDSIYCDGTKHPDGFTPWGSYLGRLVRIRCTGTHELCRPVCTSLHACNESQLFPGDVLRPGDEGMLF